MKLPLRKLRRQRGAALLALLAVAVLAFAYVITSRLNSPAGLTAVNREHNARVLSQAKQALIGWMVLNAAQTDNNPGRLPCPEGPNSIGSDFEGTAAPTVSPSTPTCPRVGRLPWRTLGLERLVDGASEPLWYAVSPGWALQTSATLLTVNSDSRGNMAIDGQAAPNDVVALIVAPGPAMNVQAAAGCNARAQARAAPGPGMDARDYLECLDATAATPAFSTAGPAASFNDQVLAVTTADLIPALEAAVAQRMQREIAPALRGLYASAQWGLTASNPMYPFAVTWTNPGTSNFRGTNNRIRGLLPVNCSEAGCASDARYSPTFVTWNTANTPTVQLSGQISGTGSCSFPNASTVRCTGTYVAIGTVTIRIQGLRASNVGMAMRRLEPSRITVEHGLTSCASPAPGSAAWATFRTDGAADLTLEGQAPGLIGPPPLTVNFCVTADLGVLADHPLVDSTHPTLGWFVRNEWHRLTYYAVENRNSPNGLSGSPPVLEGCDSDNCLRINNDSVRNIRALLVLAGRSLSNPAGRPNATLSDYVEYQNCDLNKDGICDPKQLFEQRPVRVSKTGIASINAPFNDRVVLVDWIAPAPTLPLTSLP